MSHELSVEQNALIKEIMTVPPAKRLVVSARAGSAKTYSMMVAANKLLERNLSTKIKVLVYGKANQLDIQQALPKQVDVSTVHAMAYRYTVKQFNLKLPIRDKIRASDIPKTINVNFDTVSKSIYLAEAFLNSDHLSLSKFANTLEEEYSQEVIDDAVTILTYMEKGKINITHQFYLKLFHIKVMNDTLAIDPVDVLMVEEAQDLTQVMVDVAEKYPANQKIYSGDSAQSVLAFAGSVDVLSKYSKSSVTLPLTQSFRVNVEDAKVIQHFMQTELDPDFKFTGFDKPYPDKPTFAYLTRTNAALIDKMIELERVGTPFKLSTKSKLTQMFNLPLTLATLKPGGKQINSDMQYLQDACDYYWDHTLLHRQFRTMFSYFRETFQDNVPINQAMDLVIKHGVKTLFAIHKSAKAHMKSEANLTICTAHTSKGLTFSEVELDPGMDESIIEVLKMSKNDRTDEDIATIYLFYVACSRHTHLLKSGVFDQYKQQLKEIK